jgi:hypothetical protein
MKSLRLRLRQASVAIWLTASFSFPVNAAPRLDRPPENAVVFFDVSELPARIDEPKLRQSDKGMVMDCAIANRSDEQLLGLRLILLVLDPAGKLRNRITWTERTELTRYSIKTFALNPALGELRGTDQLFLGIDEVIGHETIWRAAGAEKALRAYSRGQHDVVPTVRTFANKYDPRPGMGGIRVIPKE